MTRRKINIQRDKATQKEKGKKKLSLFFFSSHISSCNWINVSLRCSYLFKPMNYVAISIYQRNSIFSTLLVCLSTVCSLYIFFIFDYYDILIVRVGALVCRDFGGNDGLWWGFRKIHRFILLITNFWDWIHKIFPNFMFVSSFKFNATNIKLRN